MLLKSATSRNIFAIVGLGLATSIVIAAVQIAIGYNKTREATLDRMRAVASSSAASIESDLELG